MRDSAAAVVESRLREWRVFCVGDAVHRYPPNHGLGSNTSIQDSYNLAWKLAAVLRGWAGPALLDTYDAERAPVAAQIFRRAATSGRDTGQLVAALGLDGGHSPEAMQRALRHRLDPTPAGAAQREAIRRAVALKNREFNAHGTLGQVYRSGAVIGDPTVADEPPAGDPEIEYRPGTRPGGRLPHAVVGNARATWGLHDLVPYEGFTVLTGLLGQRWADAVPRIARELGVPVRAIVIGPGREVTDLYFTWSAVNGIEEDGVLLVRPDKHVAFRSVSMADDPHAALGDALRAILHRTEFPAGTRTAPGARAEEVLA